MVEFHNRRHGLRRMSAGVPAARGREGVPHRHIPPVGTRVWSPPSRSRSAPAGGALLNRNRFNDRQWRPALRAAGIAGGRDNGMHALRHLYASALLDAGESIKALSEYLGHHDPGFTLRTCTHLVPSSQARTRAAVDAMWAAPGADHGPGTAHMQVQGSDLRESQ